MYSEDVKRMFSLQGHRDAAIASSWGAVLFACILGYGCMLGWNDGGPLEGNIPLVSLVGYVIGAIVGYAFIRAPYDDQNFDARERDLELVREEWEDDPEGMTEAMRRLKRETRDWNAIMLPLTLAHRLYRALRPVAIRSS